MCLFTCHLFGLTTTYQSVNLMHLHFVKMYSPAATATKKNISDELMKHISRGNIRDSVWTVRDERDIVIRVRSFQIIKVLADKYFNLVWFIYNILIHL